MGGGRLDDREVVLQQQTRLIGSYAILALALTVSLC